MNFWEKITGSDLTIEYTAFDLRVKKLPADYRASWEKITAILWSQTDFSGRKTMSILEGVLGLFEETAEDGQSVQALLGDDIQGFCSALVDGHGIKSFRDKWRKQLNKNVSNKLGKLGE